MATMKPLVCYWLTAIVFIAACQKKSVPVISARKSPPPKIQGSVYAPAGTVQPDTVQGKTVFMARCNRCHGLPSPETYSAKQWENILLLMIPRAGIGNENAVHVKAYVLANTFKL